MQLGTEDKKKLMILGGLAGGLGVIMLIVFNPFSGGGGSTSTPEPPSPIASKAAGGPPAPGAPAGAPPAPGTPPGAPPAAPPAGGGARLVTVEKWDADPFQPHLINVPPPPPGRDRLGNRLPPPNIPLPRPDEFSSGGGSLPPMTPLVGLPGGGSGSIPPGTTLAGLPPVAIGRLHDPPPMPASDLFSPAAQRASGGAVPMRHSPNKRLSGVIMNGAVRALVEVQQGGGTVVRVVQPGDEVEGFKVLRMERAEVNGQRQMRMVIREAGEEQYVDLKSAEQQGAGGAEGAPGAGAAPGRGRGGQPPAPPFGR